MVLFFRCSIRSIYSIVFDSSNRGHLTNRFGCNQGVGHDVIKILNFSANQCKFNRYLNNCTYRQRYCKIIPFQIRWGSSFILGVQKVIEFIRQKYHSPNMCGQSSFINFQCCHLFATWREIPHTYMYMSRLDRRKLDENTCVRQSCYVPFSRFLAYPTTSGCNTTTK